MWQGQWQQWRDGREEVEETSAWQCSGEDSSKSNGGPEASKAVRSCGKDAVMAQGLQQSSKARRAAATEASDKGGGGNGGGGDEGERAAASAVAMATMEVRPKVPRWSGKEQRRGTEAAREGAASGSEDGWSGLGGSPNEEPRKVESVNYVEVCESDPSLGD